MKTYNLFLIVIVAFLFLISSCTKNQQNAESNSEFKQMCQGLGYEWMFMKPTQDGKFINDAEGCWGCMVEGIEHICDKEKLNQFVPPR